MPYTDEVMGGKKPGIQNISLAFGSACDRWIDDAWSTSEGKQYRHMECTGGFNTVVDGITILIVYCIWYPYGRNTEAMAELWEGLVHLFERTLFSNVKSIQIL